MLTLKIKILAASTLFISIVWLGAASSVNAQTAAKFLVSWRAINYVPADYQGKILPSESTPIEVSFDLIDGNKIANLSQSDISWHVNNKFLRSAPGLKTITLNSLLNGQSIRITVSDYKRQDWDYTFDIPAVRPELTINSRTVSQKLKLGEYLLAALPYFFNVTNQNEIIFQWNINNQAPANQAENPGILSLKLTSQGTPKEAEIPIQATAQNAFRQLEFASRKINFLVE